MAPDRLVRAGDLCLQKDIVERLGLNPTAVANLASGRRGAATFPRPIMGRGNRGIWLWPDIQDWYERMWPKSVEGKRAAEAAARISVTRPGRRKKR